MTYSKIRLSATLLLTALLASSALAQDARPKRDPDVPYVPTTERAVQEMLKLAAVKSSDVLYDLGCGDGRIVITAAKKYGEQDLFEAKIGDATVVTLFLLPSVNLKLRPKLIADLKPGTRVVSNTFDMGDWKAEKETALDDQDDEDTYLSHKFFLWTIPQRGAK